MSSTFVDFLNHGLLPFVGREKERERLLAFCRGDRQTERAELRATLLVGEAGSGKSRLIEEVIPEVERLGGAVVHCRLRPEGTLSPAALIVQAFERSTSARTFAAQGSDPLGTALAGLRRLCGLRRTLLVIEDIHLLAGESLHEFTVLLQGLADEPLALLATARPTESTPRAVLEGYLTDEIALKGLESEEIEQLWRLIFSTDPSAEVLDLLGSGTHGNLFALRSALRGSIRSGSISTVGSSGMWQMEIDLHQFRQTVQRSSRGMIDGVLAGLTEEELAAAHALSQLGEIFSHTAALFLLLASPARTSAPKALLNTLIFKGIIAHVAAPAAPLNLVEDTEAPLAFTHTLLHDICTQAVQPEPERMIALLLSRAPLYTIRPFNILASLDTRPTISATQLVECVEMLCEIAVALDSSSGWQKAPAAMAAAERLATMGREILEGEAAEGLAILVEVHQLHLARREPWDKRHERLPDLLALYERTRTSAGMQVLHLEVLRLLISHLIAGEVNDEVQRYIEEGLAIIAAEKEVCNTNASLNLLIVACDFAAYNFIALRELLSRLEGEIERLAPHFDEGRRTRLFLATAGYFLLLIDGPETLERCYGIEQRLRQTAPSDQLDVYEARTQFLLRVGECGRLQQELPPLIERLERLGMMGRAISKTIDLYTVQVIAGAPYEPFIEYVRWEKSVLGARLLFIALIRGDLKAARAFVEEFRGSERPIHAPKQFLHALWEDRLDDAIEHAHRLLPNERDLQRLALFCLGVTPEEDVLSLCRTLLAPPVTLFVFNEIYAALWLIEHAATQGRITPDDELRALLSTSVLACAEWFAERSLDVCLTAHLDRHGSHLDEADLKRWRTRSHKLAEHRHAQFVAEGGDRLRISMFDTITVQHPHSEPQRLRGGRNQTVLGLLVAIAMLKTPLDRSTFLRLATGIELDPERARKMWNIAALRLREVIGREALVADDELPHLDAELVHIDLLEVWRTFDEVDGAIRNGHIVFAREALLGAITEAAGRVPFPTLYDELFESLRDEFETRLRTLVLQLARRHVAANDNAGAELLLRAYIERVPDDEEGVEMLVEVLRRDQRESEAVVVLSRAESVE